MANEGKALAVRDVGAVVIRDVPGFEDFDRQDLVVPRLYLVQATSQLPGDPPVGTFWNNLTGEARPEVKAVVLRYKKTRVMFDPEDLTGGPVCASDDNEKPRAPLQFKELRTFHPALADMVLDGVFDVIDNCRTCPFGDAYWAVGGPPPCNLTYVFLCLDLEREEAPFLLSVRKTGIREAKKLISAMYFRRQPFFSVPVTIRSKKMQDQRGKWFVPYFELGEPFSEEKLAYYQAFYEDLVGVEITAAEDVEPLSEEVAEEEIPF